MSSDAVGADVDPAPGRSSQRYLRGFRFDVTVRADIDTPVAIAALGRALVAALQAAGAPQPSSVGLILTDDTEIAELNQAHLAHPGPTDVLSFPMLGPGAFPAHAGQDPAVRQSADRFALPPGRRPHLGDIVISVERAIEQANAGRGGHAGDVRWSPAREMLLLVTHGALHLGGWDHARPDEEAAMRALERRLLGMEVLALRG